MPAPGFNLNKQKRKDQPFGWSFQRLRDLRVALLFFILVDFRESENQKGSFARCDGRLEALPQDSAAFEKAGETFSICLFAFRLTRHSLCVKIEWNVTKEGL